MPGTPSTRSRGLWLLLLAACSLGALAAQGLTILTEEDPPYNFTSPQGTPSGFAVAITQEIQKRVGDTAPISVLPWARAYREIQSRGQVVLFTMARTPEREKLFQWVGPIIENRWVLVTAAKNPPRLDSLADAKKLGGIGVVRGFAWEAFLADKGLGNLEATTQNQLNVRKLAAGRIQAYASSDNTWRSEVESAGFDPRDFREALVFNKVQLYIAHSAQTDPALVKRWQQALEHMKQDGSFARILHSWFPGKELPGPAHPAE